MHDKWRFWAFLLILLGLPARGFPEGACTCEDICKMDKLLAEKENLLKAAQQVAAEAAGKTFPTVSWAKDRFTQIAFPGGNYKILGVQDYGEEPQVSKEEKEQNCDDIWQATLAHEMDHAKFDGTIPNWKYPWIMIFGQEGGVIANKEVGGYTAQLNHLREALEKLKKNCPDANCNQKPPELQRYQENNIAQRAEQKERLARSADRVGAYASALQ